jgi:hypothetical protein
MKRPVKSRLRKALKWHHEHQREDSLTRCQILYFHYPHRPPYIICLALHTTVLSVLRTSIPLIRDTLRSHAYILIPTQSPTLFFKNRKMDFRFRKLPVKVKLNVGLTGSIYIIYVEFTLNYALKFYRK